MWTFCSEFHPDHAESIQKQRMGSGRKDPEPNVGEINRSTEDLNVWLGHSQFFRRNWQPPDAFSACCEHRIGYGRRYSGHGSLAESTRRIGTRVDMNLYCWRIVHANDFEIGVARLLCLSVLEMNFAAQRRGKSPDDCAFRLPFDTQWVQRQATIDNAYDLTNANG